MPRVHKLVAAKNYPAQQIQKGDTYYKWSLRPGGRGKGMTYRSKSYPKRSQLTSSDFLGQMYDIQDDRLTVESITSADDLNSVAEDVRNLGGEQEEKLNNMPEMLQSSPTGELLQERKDAMDAWASEIEQAASDLETKLEELDDEQQAYDKLVQAWADFDEAYSAWEDEYAEWDSLDEDEAGDAPVEPEEPDEDRPDERDFDQERTEAIEEALSSIDEPSL